MKEIRLHGRGGQGVVKASQMIVKTAVMGGVYGQFIPFFGVERKGSPVYGYLWLSETPIRRKTQIHEPDVIVVMDDTLVGMKETYAGLRDKGTVIINTVHALEELNIPACAGSVAAIDASGIAEKTVGRNMPNTAMLGAFARVMGLLDTQSLFSEIESQFGADNRRAAEQAYESVRYLKGEEKHV